MHVIRFGAAPARAIVLAALMVFAAGGLPVAAQEPNDITLRLGATTGNPGDTVEVFVDLVATDALPINFVLFLAYDNTALEPVVDAYEIIARNEFTGEPIRDSEGNTIASFSPVRPSDNVLEAGKNFAFHVHEPQGAVGVSVQGQNDSSIPAGPLLTFTFRILETVPDGSMTDILGVDEDMPIHIPDGQGNVDRTSSSFTQLDPAAPLGVSLMTYGFENTAVIVGCVPADPPTGITASQNRSDSVEVSWNAVPGDPIEYRVYRSTTNNPATASPIGPQWQTETTFSDITARVPEVTPGECFAPDIVEEVHYFYWVRARSEEGCESMLSANAAEGYRVRDTTQAAAAILPASDQAGRLATLLALAALLAAGAGVPWKPARAGAGSRSNTV